MFYYPPGIQDYYYPLFQVWVYQLGPGDWFIPPGPMLKLIEDMISLGFDDDYEVTSPGIPPPNPPNILSIRDYKGFAPPDPAGGYYYYYCC